MPRTHKQILPFKIPFFRIFYSTTYTIIFLVTLVVLAITPGSLLFEAIKNDAWQYVFIIGGVYILTALIAVFIYSSRLYTNRTVLAAVGKAYIPIEDGEIGKSVRKLIVNQLERSAIISWESRPRDIKGESAFAEKEGSISAASTNDIGHASTIGTIIPVDIYYPPWDDVQHPGWTAPSDAVAELQSDLQFDVVIAELPNLLEARAVSLAPLIQYNGEQAPDPRFLEILRRQEKAGMHEYMTQLSYLQLVDINSYGRDLLSRYERARFSGVPTSYRDFKALMLAFGSVMDNMKHIDPAIAEQIQAQVHTEYVEHERAPASTRPSQDAAASSVGAYAEHPKGVTPRSTMPYFAPDNVSAESIGSVLHASSVRHSPSLPHIETADWEEALTFNSSLSDSDMGSVVHLAMR